MDVLNENNQVQRHYHHHRRRHSFWFQVIMQPNYGFVTAANYLQANGNDYFTSNRHKKKAFFFLFWTFISLL